MNRFQAGFANRQTRNPYQRFAADAAVGRKQRGKEALGEYRGPRNKSIPSGYSIRLRSPSSVPATAEDDLLSSGGYMRPPARRILLSIAVSGMLTQCVDDPAEGPEFAFGFPCAQRPRPRPPWLRHRTASTPCAASRKLAPAARNDGSNLRTAPVARQPAARHRFPRNCVVGTHTLRGCRNRGT